MANANERKALFFLAIVAISGGAVRLWRSAPAPDPDNGAAIARQIGRVDSARTAPRSSKGGQGRGSGRRPRRDSSERASQATLAAPVITPPAEPALVDLDRADAATIEALPGIGPALASRIVAHRDSAGMFGGMAAFCDVRGIGPALAQKLRPLVTFSGPPRPVSDECGEASRQGRKTSVRRGLKPR